MIDESQYTAMHVHRPARGCGFACSCVGYDAVYTHMYACADHAAHGSGILISLSQMELGLDVVVDTHTESRHAIIG